MHLSSPLLSGRCVSGGCSCERRNSGHNAAQAGGGAAEVSPVLWLGRVTSALPSDCRFQGRSFLLRTAWR